MRSGKSRKAFRRGRAVRAGEKIGLPEDALSDCARATMIGQSAVLIEGQHGVVELGTERMRLRTGRGMLTVLGEGLSIGELSADAAMIRGRIETLTYGRGMRGE